jgi:hypothetical protein
LGQEENCDELAGADGKFPIAGLSVHHGCGFTPQQAAILLASQEADYAAHDFHFKSGETLPELRLHYATPGKPVGNANGRVRNAVLILHGMGGSGRKFLVSQFAGVLFGTGQSLDASLYFIILPDNIGHGKSSKPSDGLHAHFPQYEYDDMVAAQHELLEKGRGGQPSAPADGYLDRLHAFLDLSRDLPRLHGRGDAAGCLPVEIAGRNRLLAEDGDRWHPGGSGLEERRIQRRTTGGLRDRGRYVADRWQRAPADAEKFSYAGRRRSLSRGDDPASDGNHRCQRSAVRGERLAEL